MFFKTMTQRSGTRTGLSVAFLALMSGMALAQDQGLGDDGTISILPADDVVLTDPPVDSGEEIIPDDIIPDDIIPDDIIPDEIIPDEIITDDPGVVIGEDIVLDDEIIEIIDGGEPDPCVGCEPPPDEEPADPGLPDDGVSPMPEIEDPVADGGDVGVGDPDEVTIYTPGEFPDSPCGGCEYQTMAGPTSGGPEVQRTLIEADSGADGAGETVRNDTNICYDAALYVPLLCDWQRPFVGDLMP